jgi:ribosomal protein S18 acetylase RimI-like enzyme
MTPDTLAQVMEATWPPARAWACGPFTLRDGAGGGKRVSAASCDAAWSEADLRAAEAAMAQPLFLIRDGDAALDAALGARGYHVVDPVLAYAAPVAALAGDVPWLTAFAHWPPLAIAGDLWAEGGIGAARVQVMDRVTGQKTAVLARLEDRPAGVAFVALAGEEAMLHALEVRPSHRRRGVAATVLRAAANWAQAQGAVRLSLVVTAQNLAARALYTRAGMQVVGQYHYRMK